jgi:hypothetical protein
LGVSFAATLRMAVVDIIVPCAARERLQLGFEVLGILAGQGRGLDRPTGAHLVASRARRQPAGDIAVADDVDAKIETALVVMTEDERRAQARQAIAEAFAERPLKLIEGEVIEADAAETLATEPEMMGRKMGSTAIPEASSLESQDE